MPFLSLELRNNTKAGADQAKSDLEKVSRAYDQVSQATERTSRGLQNANSSIKDATANVKQLAAQVVGLVSAYKALNAAKGFVQRGIEFSSSLEDAQTSIGSIIAATNKISTAEGKQLEDVEKFNAALSISQDMMDQLQVLALESTASFDDIVSGVSGIIAPAAKAGLEMEKLPKFTVTAAQAMMTMKVPIQQIRTEIEALLSGNINKAQDILATNLGITGEMVRNWKEQGILVDQLMAKLEPFALAGERVANSWSGLKSNMSDALDYLGKVTGKGLFESLKQSYRELLELIISTENGKPGISAEFENIASLMRDIQDAIGDGILDLTRDLIEELEELNKPENIAEIKRSFSEFKDVTVELFGAVKEVAGAVTSFVATSMQGWSNMPDIIQEMGIVGAVAFGAKGRAALLGIGAAVEMLEPLFALANEGQGGADAYKAYWAQKEQKGTAPALASSHGGNEIPPSTASSGATGGAYKITPATSDSGKKASSSVDNARQKIAELRREIEQMQGSSTKTVSDLAKKFEDIAKAGKSAGLSAEQVNKLQQEYRDAFQTKTLEDFNKELMQAQGNTTALKNIQIAETLRGWTQQFQAAGMTAEQYAPKIAQLKTALEQQQEYKDLQTAANFYQELGDLSGEYGESLEYQNRLIEQQAQLWLQAGIPLADVERRVALMREEMARDPFSGLVRGARKWAAETTDYAANIEGALTSAFDNAADALANFALTGKMNFADLGNSILQMLARIGAQQAIGGIVGGLTNALGGFFGGGGLVGQAKEVMSFIPGIAHSGWYVGREVPADGFRSVPAMAFEGAPRLHSGGGWFRSDEYPAILQRGERVLNRDETAAYHAGMAAGGNRGNSSDKEPAVYVTINNTTGEPVSTQRSRDGNGNTNIEVLVGNVVAKRLASPGTELNRAVRATTGSRQSVIGR